MNEANPDKPRPARPIGWKTDALPTPSRLPDDISTEIAATRRFGAVVVVKVQDARPGGRINPATAATTIEAEVVRSVATPG